ncbi:ornithine cyclodeaminase [Nitrososphaera viennensis]|uniref:Ornithine cyclodeaminase n=2 Tax=Nitrososphaera viennensis TaxID=1034015 RepID=A0A060HJE4_9ARCH|nr:TIGR00300 family protein [Nitrososphaera viennensis]AIC15643.1 LOR/SDH bifunctional protein [Nitrososphaera viennensis EN76]UVS70518.1 TIGR00300 family protein [Nitrososphaera viennensis]
MAAGKHEQEIEVRGHLIDSMILTRIFDHVMDLKGDFQVLEFTVGKKKKDPSYARLLVRGKDEEHLERIIEAVYREGAQPVSVQEAMLVPASSDCVMPDDFYSTTNNPTQVFYAGQWIQVQNMMMDKCIVVDTRSKTAECKMIRDLKKGDMIVVGERGVKITPQERPREGVDIFQFMSSSSSSERPTQHIARKVADDIYNTKKQGGKIIVVSGPVLVHSGASEALARLIRMGYIDGLLAGNAIAVHDVENALLGTSLGMHVRDGTLAVRGHRNHMQAINEVFKAGGLRAMVEKKILKSGVMYECIKNDVPFVLAGSIRDDGPIPDVVTDVVEAQRRYKKVLKGARMVLMFSTMLHSIAVGNMLPSSVKVVAVDISQPVVTKLVDRGTAQAVGIVTDVGAFLPIVADHLEKMARHRQ